MTIKRYILIAIPFVCVFCIIASLIAYKPEKDTRSPKETATPPKESMPGQKQIQDAGNAGTLTQTVEGLSVPRYDEKGKEILVMRGENTLLLNNNVYKIFSPEIEVLDSSIDTENGTQSIFITSDNGEMDNTSNEGSLSENVIVHFDQETQLNTDYLRYLPDKKIVYTDNIVTILGKGIEIKGQGCEIDLINKMMWIKKDAEMEMDGMNNDLFSISENNTFPTSPTPSSTDESPRDKTSPGKTLIRSSGQLIFNRQPDTNIMTFHDHVEVKRGASTVFSDKLVVFLDPETKKTRQAIASGNVLASEGSKIAKGSSLTWDVTTQTAILEDTHKAEFVQDDLNIDAQKIIFYKDTGNIDIPGAGNLRIYTKRKTNKRDTPAESGKPDNMTTIKWDGKMKFLNETSEANFEKNVEVRREDSVLLGNNLNVTFDNHDHSLKTLKATENIHIINKKSNLYGEAVGDQVIWNVRNNTTVLKGRPFALLREGNKRKILAPRVLFYGSENNVLCEGKGSLYEKGEESLSSNSIENTDLKVNWTKKMVYNSLLKKASFYEEAQATRGGYKLNGDQIDAYLDANQNIHKIISTNNVYFSIIQSGNEDLSGTEGLGTFFVWDLIQNVALLTGDPKAELRKGITRSFSEKVYFDMMENRITWEGRPHWHLIGKEIQSKK